MNLKKKTKNLFQKGLNTFTALSKVKKIGVISLASFALIAIGASNQSITIKTNNGYSITFKKENVSCIKTKGVFGHPCQANGVSTDLTGQRTHYSERVGDCVGSAGQGKSNAIPCAAGRRFGLIK